LFSQSPELQAKSAYLAAEQAYSEGDFSKSLTKLLSAEKSLGSTNARIEWMKVKVYTNLENWTKAKKSINLYFEVAAESDNNYNEALLALDEIVEKSEKERILINRLDVTNRDSSLSWSELQTSLLELELYKSEFGRAHIAKIIHEYRPWVYLDPRDFFVYNTRIIGDYQWFSFPLRHVPSTDYDPQEYPNLPISFGGIHYHYIPELSGGNPTCPKGWSVPSVDQINQLIKDIQRMGTDVNFFKKVLNDSGVSKHPAYSDSNYDLDNLSIEQRTGEAYRQILRYTWSRNYHGKDKKGNPTWLAFIVQKNDLFGPYFQMFTYTEDKGIIFKKGELFWKKGRGNKSHKCHCVRKIK
jgi:uncharacterized protein (TIGR02145 family)